jgi:putative acetyltransferase
VLIRAEQDCDWPAVYALNAAAFETSAEADLVDRLRVETKTIISLVADDVGQIVGHIMFSPVSLTGHPGLRIMGLAPMAVATPRQRSGIGTLLVRAGLDRCLRMSAGAAVVLGHPDYYPRFGFVPAVNFAIRCEFEVPDEAFMVMELQPGYLRGAKGTVKYLAAFDKL